MCNTLHKDFTPIPKEGKGYKILGVAFYMRMEYNVEEKVRFRCFITEIMNYMGVQKSPIG